MIRHWPRSAEMFGGNLYTLSQSAPRLRQAAREMPAILALNNLGKNRDPAPLPLPNLRGRSF